MVSVSVFFCNKIEGKIPKANIPINFINFLEELFLILNLCCNFFESKIINILVNPNYYSTLNSISSTKKNNINLDKK